MADPFEHQIVTELKRYKAMSELRIVIARPFSSAHSEIGSDVLSLWRSEPATHPSKFGEIYLFPDDFVNLLNQHYTHINHHHAFQRESQCA